MKVAGVGSVDRVAHGGLALRLAPRLQPPEREQLQYRRALQPVRAEIAADMGVCVKSLGQATAGPRYVQDRTARLCSWRLGLSRGANLRLMQVEVVVMQRPCACAPRR